MGFRMKKLTVFAAFVAAAAVFGCTKEQSPVSEKTTVLSASIIETKTVLADNGLSVLWSADDAISVNGTASSSIALSDDCKSATFTIEGELSQPYKAVFPASSWVDATHVSIPATQTYAENSFGATASVMAAYTTEGSSLSFNNVMSMIKFTLKAEKEATITSIDFAGIAGEQVSGSFAIDYTAETIAISSTGSTAAADKTVRLGGNIAVGSEGTAIYIAVPAQTYAQGITLTITDSEGNTMVQSVAKELTFSAGRIKEFTAPLTFEPKVLVQPTSTPAKLYLGGAAAEANSQEMRKEGDKFIIFNKLTAGKYTLTDGNGNKYFSDAAGKLYIGEGETTVEASAEVSRLIVDFSNNTVAYDRVGNDVYVQNAWDGIVMASIPYQGLGVWKGTGTITCAANGDERYSLRAMINGNHTRWGSNKGNDGIVPDGTAAFWRLYETAWDQWNNLYKFYRGYQGVEAVFSVDGNNLEYMRHSVEVNTTAEVTLGGFGAECACQPFRKVSSTEHVIYSRIKSNDVKYTVNGEEHALAIPSDLVGQVVRITLNLADGTATYAKIDEWAHMKFEADGSDIAHIDYKGNGIWKGVSGGIWWRDMGGWFDERYYFNIKVNDVEKCWGMHANAVHSDLHYNNDESFWNMDEYDYVQWAHPWKLDSEIKDGATADVEINTNNDGVWNHTITKK